MMFIPNRVRVLAVMLALALVGGLLTLALLAKPSQAQPPTDNENRGAGIHQFEIGLVADVTDCTGEYIHLTGTVHSVDQYFETDGGFHLHTHFNLTNGRGVGLDPQTLEPTGTKYIITSAGSTIENFVRTGDFVAGQAEMQVVIGKGQADDQVGILQFHYIIEVVDGEPTVKVDTENIFLKCQPGNVTPPPATASATAPASPTATDSPGTGSAPLAMGAGVLLVGVGLAARRLF